MAVTRMGVCPVCDLDIKSNQRTAYRMVDEVPQRIHAAHLPLKYRLEQSGMGRSYKCRSVCDCGWKSVWVPNSGLAGRAWDDHVDKEHG